MDNIDWWYLKKPLIILLIAILLSTSMVFVGYYFQAIQFQVHQQLASVLKTVKNQYRNQVNDLNLLTQYEDQFNDYQSRGLSGEANRLSWIENLQSINRGLKLPMLKYRLSPEEKFQRPGLKVNGNVNVNSTAMVLNMKMLHEEDLFAVLTGLRQQVKNLFTVDSCQLNRIGDMDHFPTIQKANLEAHCTIRWISIDIK